MKWRIAAVVTLCIAGLFSFYLDFIWSPPEAQMGNVVRIMYFHIASAVDAFLAFGVVAVAGFLMLVLRFRRLNSFVARPRTGVFALVFDPWAWDRLALSSAQIALVFTSFVLISGSIWGAAVWNTWWTWDPTLTTTLILWFLNVGYLLLRSSIADRGRAATVSAVFGIVAALDVPLIHESVTWWKGLHPEVITDAGFNMPPSMVITLLISFGVFLCVYALFVYLAYMVNWQRSELRSIRLAVRDRLAQMDQASH